MGLSKNKIIFLTFLVMFCILISIMFYVERRTEFFKEVVFKKKDVVEDIKAVRCNVQSNLDSQTFVSITFLIPYNEKDEQAAINRAMPQLRSRVLGAMSTSMSKDIREKNFQGIKEKLIEIINTTVDVKVNEVYLDTFNLMDHPGRTS